MKSKSRRAQSDLPATNHVAPVVATPLAGWGPQAGLLALVMVLVACYVVLFFAQREHRWGAMLLVFSPDHLLSLWTGDAYKLPMGFVDRLPILLVAGCIVAIAWASGSIVVRGWKLDQRLTRLETELFSVGVGLSLWSIWTLLIGLLGLLSQTWLLWLPAIVATSLAGFQLAGRKAALGDNAPKLPSNDNDWLWPSVLWLGLPFALMYIFAGALPPREFDVLEYHLQAPKEWFLTGRIEFLPHNIYANMPLGAEMYALLGMTIMPGESGWWYGALVGKTVLAIVGVLTALVLFAAGRRSGSNTAGVIAALVYISTPWSLIISVTGYNEGLLAFYFALATYAVWLWRMEPDDSASEHWLSTKSHLLRLAGFLAGSAAAVKYPALLLVVFPLALAVTVGHRKFAWKAGAMFMIGALAACGLWYAKNIAFTGNPVYPLAYNVFGGETRDADKHAQWATAHQVPRDANGNRYSLPQLGSAIGDALMNSPWLSPLLWPLAILAVLAKSQRKTAFWLAMLLLFFAACWWLFTHRIERFAAPAIVLVAWLAGIGATWTAIRPWRHFLIGILFWGLVANGMLMAWAPTVEGVQEALPLNLYVTDLQALRTELAPPAHRHLNLHTPSGYEVLLVGDAEPFDLDPPALYNTCFDDVIFDQIFKDHSRDERLAVLRAQKIAYIYFDWSALRRYRAPGNYGYSDYATRKRVYEELVRDQKLLKKVNVEALDDKSGELFEVIGVVLKPQVNTPPAPP